MAAFTTNTPNALNAASRPSLMERFDAFFLTVAKARTCAKEVEALQDLSDAQLAERGLTRESIVRHAARGFL